MHSWRVLILPYLNEQDLYDEYRFDEPWDGPHNRQLADRIPVCLQCPSFARSQDHHGLETARFTSYVAVSGQGTAFNGTRPVAYKDLKDGWARTVFIVDVRNAAVPWTQPLDRTPAEILPDIRAARDLHLANHESGAHLALGDSTVRFVSAEIDTRTFRCLCTINDGEELGDF